MNLLDFLAPNGLVTFLAFFLNLSTTLTSLMQLKKKKGQSRVDLYCYDAQPCQISFFNSQKPKCKNDSQWESKLFPRASKELTQYVNVLNRTLACILTSALHGSKNKTSAMDVFPVDAIMSTRPVSNYSSY